MVFSFRSVWVQKIHEHFLQRAWRHHAWDEGPFRRKHLPGDGEVHAVIASLSQKETEPFFRSHPRVKPVCVSPKGTLDKVKSLCKSGYVWNYFSLLRKVKPPSRNTTSPREKAPPTALSLHKWPQHATRNTAMCTRLHRFWLFKIWQHIRTIFPPTITNLAH